MSAWVVERGVIDAIVQQAVIEGLVPLESATEVGKNLWFENIVSVGSRYAMDPESEESQRYLADHDEYVFTGVEAPLDGPTVMKQLHCLDYQSCEHDGWSASTACALVSALLGILTARHGDSWLRVNRKWGISTIEEAIAA